MPATQPSKKLRALCHEHHVEMRLNQSLTYVCTEHDCLVRYNTSRGYFMLSQNGNIEEDMVPRVRCPHDGAPMYLDEISVEKRDFRLWRCPQCEASRSNEEGLIGSQPSQTL
jgi:hypothetical protein